MAEAQLNPRHSSQRHGHVLLPLRQSWSNTAEALRNQIFYFRGRRFGRATHAGFFSIYKLENERSFCPLLDSHILGWHLCRGTRTHLPADPARLSFAFPPWDRRGWRRHARHFLTAPLWPQPRFRSVLAPRPAGSQPLR